VLSAICAFLGVDYSAEMLGYTADAPQYPPPDPSLVAQWKTRLAPRDVALVELRTGTLLTSRGYALSGYPRANVARARHELLLADSRLRRFRTRLGVFGPQLVALDMLGRQLHLPRLEKHARMRMNAVEQRMIDQESAGIRAPSANIAPSGPTLKDESGRSDV